MTIEKWPYLIPEIAKRHEVGVSIGKVPKIRTRLDLFRVPNNISYESIQGYGKYIIKTEASKFATYLGSLYPPVPRRLHRLEMVIVTKGSVS